MLATAADIPPELFEYILDCLAPRDLNEDAVVQTNKHELGLCALTSRFWAKKCQPRLFSDITLKTRDDVYQLTSFIDADEHISQYIYWLILDQKGPCEPWIHLVSTLLCPKLSPTIFVKLSVTNPLHPSARQSMRSIHALLPRVCPGFSSNLHHLHLCDIHFKDFADLVCLVGELPMIMDVHCHKLSWDTHSTTRISRRRSPDLAQVTVSECPQSWLAIWIHIGPQRVPPSVDQHEKRAYNLFPDEQIAAVAVTQAIHACIDRSLTLKPEVMGKLALTSTYHNGVDAFKISCINVLAVPGLEPSYVQRHHLTPRLEIIFTKSVGVPVTTQTLHVALIVLDCVQTALTLDQVLTCDWKSFSEYATLLGRLQKVIFGFRSGEDSVRFFRDAVIPYMPSLQSAGKLFFAIRDDNRACWLQALAEDEGTSDEKVPRVERYLANF